MVHYFNYFILVVRLLAVPTLILKRRRFEDWYALSQKFEFQCLISIWISFS